MASAITQWFSSAVDAIMQGGQDLKKTLNGLFKAVFTEAMKPGLKELQQLLMNGFKVQGIPFIGNFLDANLPKFITQGLQTDLYFGGTSILIVVGVAVVARVPSQDVASSK